MSKQTRIQFHGGQLGIAKEHALGNHLPVIDPLKKSKRKRSNLTDRRVCVERDGQDLPDQTTRPKVQLTYPEHLLHGFPYQPVRITLDQDPRCVQVGTEWQPWWSAMIMPPQNANKSWWLEPVTLTANLIDPSLEMMKHIMTRELGLALDQIDQLDLGEMAMMFDQIILVMLPEPPSCAERCHPMDRLVGLPKLFTETMYAMPSRFQSVLYMFHHNDIIHLEYLLPDPSTNDHTPSSHQGVDNYGRVRLSSYGVPPTPPGMYEWHDNDDMKKCANQHGLDIGATVKRLLGGNTSCLTDYRQRRFIIPRSDLNLMATAKFKVYGLPKQMTLTQLLEPYVQSQPVLTNIRYFTDLRECEAYASLLRQDQDGDDQHTTSFLQQVQDQWIHQDDYMNQYAIQHPNQDLHSHQSNVDDHLPAYEADAHRDHQTQDDVGLNESQATSPSNHTHIGVLDDKQDHVGYAIARDVLLIWLFLEHLQFEFKLHVEQNLVKVQSIGIFFETPEQLKERLPDYLARCAMFIDQSQDQTELYNYQTGQSDVWRTRSELQPVDWQILSTLLLPEPIRSYLIVYYDQAKQKQLMEIKTMSDPNQLMEIKTMGDPNQLMDQMSFDDMLTRDDRHQDHVDDHLLDDANRSVFSTAAHRQRHIYHKAAPLSALQHEQILDAYYWVHMASQPKLEYAQVLQFYQDRGYAIRIKHGYVRTGRHSGRCSASGHRRNYDAIRQSAYSIPSKYTCVNDAGEIVAIVRQPRPTKSKYAHLARQHHQTPFEYDLFQLGIKDNLKRPVGEIAFLMKSVHHRHKAPEEILPANMTYSPHAEHDDAPLSSIDHPTMLNDHHHSYLDSNNLQPKKPMLDIPPIDEEHQDRMAMHQSYDGIFEPIALDHIYSIVPAQEPDLQSTRELWEVVSEPFDHQSTAWLDFDPHQHSSSPMTTSYAHPSNSSSIDNMGQIYNPHDDQSKSPTPSDETMTCATHGLASVSPAVARVFAWHGQSQQNSVSHIRQPVRRHYKKKVLTNVVPLDLSNIINASPNTPLAAPP